MAHNGTELHPSAEELSAYSRQVLDIESAERVKSHVDGCQYCTNILDSLGTVTNSAEATISSETQPTSLVNSLGRQRTLLDRYEIHGELGKGGFGTVYRAWDHHLERLVALKIPHQRLIEDPRVQERYMREARAVAAIRHPGICPIYEVHGRNGEPLILSLAFIDGQTLALYVRTKGKLLEDEAAQLCAQVARAVHEAHRRGILHRDLKPENILIAKPDHQPVVTDFGLARRTASEDATLTQQGAVMGTPAYMSPEQARGDIRNLTAKTDIYSLGVILYELLSSQRPFSGNPMQVISQILTKDPPHPRKICPNITPQLERVCLKAMAKQPEDRFESMEQFAEALEDIGNSGVRTRSGRGTNQPSANDSPQGRGFTLLARQSRIILLTLALMVVGILSLVPFLAGTWNSSNGQSQSDNDTPVRIDALPSTPSAAMSPIVGRWRIFSSLLSEDGQLLEISPNGEATLLLPDGNTATAQYPVRLSYKELPLDGFNDFYMPLQTSAYRSYLVGGYRRVNLAWMTEILDSTKTYPITDLGLNENEQWDLILTDQDHGYGGRYKLLNSPQLEEPTRVEFDLITIIRESALVAPLLSPPPWLITPIRYTQSSEQGALAVLFFPEGSLYLAPNRHNTYGGREGRNGYTLTYRVLNIGEKSVELEVRASLPEQKVGDHPQLMPLSSREIWRLEYPESVSGDVLVEQSTRIVEIRSETYTVVVDINGKKVPEERVKSYGIEVPVIKNWVLSVNHPDFKP